jgi:hypothetical protein
MMEFSAPVGMIYRTTAEADSGGEFPSLAFIS